MSVDFILTQKIPTNALFLKIEKKNSVNMIFYRILQGFKWRRRHWFFDVSKKIFCYSEDNRLYWNKWSFPPYLQNSYSFVFLAISS